MAVTPQVVVTPALTLQVATGETCYPAEGGFSALWAEFTTSDPTLTQTLVALAGQEHQVLLRCAMLDVTGRMTKLEKTERGTRFVFSINELVYRKPDVGNVV